MDYSVADMYGPEFLVLYGIVIAITLLVCRWRLRKADTSQALPPPLVPAELDPYEMAFLRGGENEVVRLAILALIQRGYLQVTETPKSWFRAAVQRIEKSPNHPDARHLSEMENEIFDWFTRMRTAQDVFQMASPTGHFGAQCRNFEERLQAEQLLSSKGTRSSAWLIRLMGVLVIAGLGGFKLVMALSKGHTNVIFLIIMGVVSIIILLVMREQQRLTERGRSYLENVQLALDGLKNRATHASSGTADPSLLLLVGVFGIGVLSGTTYDYYPKMFQRAAASNTGSCSTSTGSCGGTSCGSTSSCGGGGGGSGCGGCGGGD
jgi:uncharacterized protein (TIGR04222 family)